MAYPTDQIAVQEEQSLAQVPHNRAAEEATIGAVMLDSNMFHECRLHIKSAEEFYIHRHRMMWAAYEALFDQRKPVDLITLSEQLEKQGQLEDVGGSAYITSLLSQVAFTYNAPSYAEMVHKDFVRRQMLGAANKIATIVYDKTKELDDVISSSTHALSSAVLAGTPSRIHTISQAVSIVYDKIEERAKAGLPPGIPTGFLDLDNLLGGGAQNSDLYMVAGRPGKGKTAILFQMAVNAAYYKVEQKVYKKRVAIFSLEMPEEQVILRMIAQMTGIDFQQLRSGRIPELKISEYISAIDILSQLDIVIDDTPAISPAYVRSRCEILNSERKLDIVFLDSLNLMKSGLKFNRGDQEVDYNARELKNVAREFDIPVWVAHQMNRGIEHRSDNARPILADLQEGGEKDSDFVMFVYHDEDEIKKKINFSELIVGKHRNGPTANIPVVFIQNKTKFENATRGQQ